MIRVSVTRRRGHIVIECKGHGPKHVCSAASMMQQACILGLRDLAKQFPKDLSFMVDLGTTLPDESLLDSPDLRLMAGNRGKRR